MKEALATVEMFFLCGWRFLNHFDIAAIQLAVSCSEVYFVRCCALKRTILVGKQGQVFN